MSMSLYNHKLQDYFDASRTSWRNLLELAQTFGWEPEGTVLPPEKLPFPDIGTSIEELKKATKAINWCGTYYSNDFQIVTNEDAHAMAAALTKSLIHIPIDKSDKPDWIQSIEFADEHRMDQLFQRSLRTLMAVDDAVGDILEALGKIEEAVKSWEKSLKAGNESELLKEKLERYR